MTLAPSTLSDVRRSLRPLRLLALSVAEGCGEILGPLGLVLAA